MFDRADYERAATELAAPMPHIQAVTYVEAAGETFWQIGNAMLPPIRFEAHIFGRETQYRFSASYPELSCVYWTPSLAAKTREGAWKQFADASVLDRTAAICSTSWGAFQIMGFHWKALKYPTPSAFADSMYGPSDDGQMDAFVRLVKNDSRMLNALRKGQWRLWEQLYNGGGQGGAYATKIENALPLFSSNLAALPRVLRMGVIGTDVARLQTALKMPVVDGHFGPATSAAVKTFQSKNDLVVDGIAGRMTLDALGV